MKTKMNIETTFSISTRKSQKDKILVIEKVLSCLQTFKNISKRDLSKILSLIQDLILEIKSNPSPVSIAIDVDSVSTILTEFYETLPDIDSEKIPSFLRKGYLEIVGKADLSTTLPGTIGLFFSFAIPLFHFRGMTEGKIFIEGKGEFQDKKGEIIKFSFDIEYEFLNPEVNLSAFVDLGLFSSSFDDNINLKISINKKSKDILKINLKNIPFFSIFNQLNYQNSTDEDFWRCLIKIFCPFSTAKRRQYLLNKIMETLKELSSF